MMNIDIAIELNHENMDNNATEIQAVEALARDVAAGEVKPTPIKNEDVAWVQRWLNERAGCDLVVDGVWGTASRAAFLSAFAYRHAPAITRAELLQIAHELGDVDTRRIEAVAKVESNGSGWFESGLPKILYERHKFWKHVRNVAARVVSWFANPQAGGYTMDINKNGINDSWEKLAFAMGKDPLAALKSVSIGKFQVLGEHYAQCGYDHPIEMLWAASRSELAQYQMLRDYILHVADLKPEFLALSRHADTNRAFARGYNGVKYEKYAYHTKLADALA
ncbi:N-acetylmuramidase domain-containing protein [Alysiella crassa]|nr:N-acetylmuramidase domain-containing protein [Alysiella crassa]UOP06503.1 N-acetylmuramidase family protein [Alysiella crassa]